MDGPVSVGTLQKLCSSDLSPGIRFSPVLCLVLYIVTTTVRKSPFNHVQIHLIQ